MPVTARAEKDISMKITKTQLRKIVKEAIRLDSKLSINELFWSKKHSPEVYHQAFLDVGYSERNIRSAIPNLAKSLSDNRVNPGDVVIAIEKLLQSPRDHIAGIPGGKAIYKELRKMGAVK